MIGEDADVLVALGVNVEMSLRVEDLVRGGADRPRDCSNSPAFGQRFTRPLRAARAVPSSSQTSAKRAPPTSPAHANPSRPVTQARTNQAAAKAAPPPTPAQRPLIGVSRVRQTPARTDLTARPATTWERSAEQQVPRSPGESSRRPPSCRPLSVHCAPPPNVDWDEREHEERMGDEGRTGSGVASGQPKALYRRLACPSR